MRTFIKSKGAAKQSRAIKTWMKRNKVKAIKDSFGNWHNKC